MQYYGTIRGHKYLRLMEMVSSGGAMISKYFTHKSRSQIARFHRSCAVVNLQNDANRLLGTMCDKWAAACNLTFLVCKCQTENVLTSVQNCREICSKCFGDVFFTTVTFSLVLIFIYCRNKSLSHTANQQKKYNSTQ
jgi:hypothetical protein